MISVLAARDVPDYWEGVIHWVDEACKYGTPGIGSKAVLSSLLDGFAQLCLLVDDGLVKGCLVMEARGYGDGSQVANVWLMGSEPGLWAKMGSEIECFLDHWSAEHQCDSISFQGRPGWQKVLTGWDVKPTVVAYRKRNPGRADTTAVLASHHEPRRPGSPQPRH